MSNQSITDDLFDFMLLKQRVIDGMSEGPMPNQEFELDSADQIIRGAITHARSVVLKIRAVNKAAYDKGVEDTKLQEADNTQ